MEEVIEAAFRNDGAVAGIVVVDQQSRRRGEQADGGQGSGELLGVAMRGGFRLAGVQVQEERDRRGGRGKNSEEGFKDAHNFRTTVWVLGNAGDW